MVEASGCRAEVIEEYAYAAIPAAGVPDWEAWGGGEQAGPSWHPAEPDPPASIPVDLEEHLAEETRASFEAGRAQGLEQGRAAERASQATVQQRLADQLQQLLRAFAQERDRYLQAVEVEVVKLSLAVAARILRREAQMDPLLLAGAVRVALGQLAASTRITLRVPPAELHLWKESMALLPDLAVPPEVLPGDGMRPGDCMVETTLGSVDLGVRAQLGEIERGFFDRASGTWHHEPARDVVEQPA